MIAALRVLPGEPATPGGPLETGEPRIRPQRRRHEPIADARRLLFAFRPRRASLTFPPIARRHGLTFANSFDESAHPEITARQEADTLGDLYRLADLFGEALREAKADATLLWIKAQEDAGLDIGALK